MAFQTTLPLTQQAIAWVLQGLGYLDKPGRVKRSSAKSAIRGEVIPRAWRRLVEEALLVMGVSPAPEQMAMLSGLLHELDRRVSGLDPLGLPSEDRMPPVLRLLAPHLGVRMGALAALYDSGTWRAPVGEEPKPLPLGDWLCDPLNPAIFGRIAEIVFRLADPSWSPWNVVAEKVERQGVVTRKSVARWRSAELHVPNLGQLQAVARLVKDPEIRKRAEFALRAARLLTVIRQSLSAEWTDAVQAEEVAAAVSSWARVARQVLQAPGLLADLVDVMAKGLEGPGGADLLTQIGPWVQQAVPVGDPTESAAALRLLAGNTRVNGDITGLRWFVALQVLSPNPLVVVGVATQLGAGYPWVFVTDNVVATIQETWRGLALLRRISECAWAIKPGKELPDLRSQTLSDHARRLLERSRCIVRTPGPEPDESAELLSFVVQLATEAGGVDAISQVIEGWNSAQRLLAAPYWLEPVASSADVEQTPHLAAHRAQRLANSGDEAESIRNLALWRDQSQTKTWTERIAAAEAMASIAHRRFDGWAQVRSALLKLANTDLGALPPPLLAKIRDLARTVTELHAVTMRVALALFENLLAVLGEPPDASARASRLGLLLPLALRLDGVASEFDDHEYVEFTRAEPLIDELESVLEAVPSHGDAWAVLALWQAVVEEENGLALKRADHYGARETFERLVTLMRGDGLLDQG